MHSPALEWWRGPVVVGRAPRATIYQPIPKILRTGTT
jgi:hypothetical protein